MTQIEYLQSIRQLSQADVDELESRKSFQYVSAEEFFEAHTHHEESHYGNSH